MPYGGVERQRISSQCLKAKLRDKNAHLVRTDDDGTVQPDTMAELGERLGIALSYRSAYIGERLLADRLQKAGAPEAWADALMALWRRPDEERGEAEGDDNSTEEKGEAEGDDNSTSQGRQKVKTKEKRQPVVVGDKEIDALVTAAKVMFDAEIAPDQIRDYFTKPRMLLKAPQGVQDAIGALRAMVQHAGLDGALFGRMATGVAVGRVDACVHVAHSLTVHRIANVADFFSTQDEFKETEAGGSYIGTSEIASSLFYGYAVIDLRQLKTNLAGLNDAQRASLVAWLVHALALVEPAAKLGSTAPYAGLRDLMVEIGRRQPRTLIGAFEVPVEAAAGRRMSADAHDRLVAHAEEMDALCGTPDQRLWLQEYLGGDKPAVEALSDAVEKTVLAADRGAHPGRASGRLRSSSTT
jgi:CRISPR system Cascade subunit CasC